MIRINAKLFQVCRSMVETTPACVSDQQKTNRVFSLLRDLARTLSFNPVSSGMPCYILGRKLLSALQLYFISPYLPEYLINFSSFSISFYVFYTGSFPSVYPLSHNSHTCTCLFTHHPLVALALQMQLWAYTAKAQQHLVLDYSLCHSPNI